MKKGRLKKNDKKETETKGKNFSSEPRLSTKQKETHRRRALAGHVVGLRALAGRVERVGVLVPVFFFVCIFCLCFFLFVFCFRVEKKKV